MKLFPLFHCLFLSHCILYLLLNITLFEPQNTHWPVLILADIGKDPLPGQTVDRLL